jgi:hypothetical protein
MIKRKTETNYTEIQIDLKEIINASHYGGSMIKWNPVEGKIVAKRIIEIFKGYPSVYYADIPGNYHRGRVLIRPSKHVHFHTMIKKLIEVENMFGVCYDIDCYRTAFYFDERPIHRNVIRMASIDWTGY